MDAQQISELMLNRDIILPDTNVPFASRNLRQTKVARRMRKNAAA